LIFSFVFAQARSSMKYIYTHCAICGQQVKIVQYLATKLFWFLLVLTWGFLFYMDVLVAQDWGALIRHYGITAFGLILVVIFEPKIVQKKTHICEDCGGKVKRSNNPDAPVKNMFDFPEDWDLKKRMDFMQKKMTDVAVQIAEDINIDLDYTHESVKVVEAILGKFHEQYLEDQDVDAAKSVAIEFGYYLVSTMNRYHIDGHWLPLKTDDGEEYLAYAFPERSMALLPIEWCEDRVRLRMPSFLFLINCRPVGLTAWLK